jgi:formate dehydrogenase subunit beta
MRTLIPVDNSDALTAIRGFLKQLLETKVVEAIMVPMETPAGTITPALVADPALLDAANPLAPVMGLNAARLAGKISIREPRGRVGVVLRPCELRALVELVKLQQASLDDLVTIGVDCVGTYDVPVYLEKRLETSSRALSRTIGDQRLWRELYDSLQSPIPDLRDACQMCEKPHVERADVTFELFAGIEAGISISLPDEIAGKLPPLLSPPRAGGREEVIEAGGRDEVIERIVAARTEVRDARFAEMQKHLDEEGIEGVLAACVRCYNCMSVCPICYCKTCLFKGPTFDHEPMQYPNWARRKGAYRLPADTMLFHLTRLNHMVLSCVGCGMCTSNCPADLPVGRVFRAIGQQVQAVFDYEPGRSVDEPLPLITFREDEWAEVGEE